MKRVEGVLQRIEQTAWMNCAVNVLCGLWMLASAVFFFGFFTAAFVEANREMFSGLFP
jgi:hypothetical protein